MKKTINSNLKQGILYFTAIGFSVLLLLFVITCTWIGYEVKSNCQKAQRQYGGSCVKALTVFVDDKRNSFRERNSAIWALGQLGDNSSLPVLQKYYTGNIPAREPLDKSVSQYELKKAINLAGGGFNITAIFWRDDNIK